MSRSTSPVADLCFGGFLLAACSAVLWESRDIPPGTFEPLGSGPVPRVVAGVIIVLTVYVMLRAWTTLHAGVARKDPDAPAPRWADVLVLSALTLAYALALHLRLGRFDMLSSVYLFLAIGVLVRFERRRLPVVAGVALLTGFGSQFLFTRVFVVDLPGGL